MHVLVFDLRFGFIDVNVPKQERICQTLWSGIFDIWTVRGHFLKEVRLVGLQLSEEIGLVGQAHVSRSELRT